METGADKAVPCEDVANGYVLHPKKTVSVIDTFFFFWREGLEDCFPSNVGKAIAGLFLFFCGSVIIIGLLFVCFYWEHL